MMQFTEEQKAALIEYCESRISELAPYAKQRQVMEIALASLTAEPVAYIMGEETIDDFNRGYEFFAVRDAKDEPDMPSVPLYTAPPAPELRLPSELEPASNAECEEFFCDGYNACLDEIKRLNATAPQPVKLPDDGLDDCIRDWGPEQARNNFDTGYNYASWRYQQELEKAGYPVEGE